MQYCRPNVCCLPYPQWDCYCTWPNYNWQAAVSPAYLYYSTCYHHIALCTRGTPKTSEKLPREMLVDSVTKNQQAFIGGSEQVSLTLEYLKDAGATNPQVTVSVTENGNTAKWNIAGIPDEYQVKSDFSSVSPGAVVALDVVECTARLRWCEVICC